MSAIKQNVDARTRAAIAAQRFLDWRNHDLRAELRYLDEAIRAEELEKLRVKSEAPEVPQHMIAYLVDMGAPHTRNIGHASTIEMIMVDGKERTLTDLVVIIAAWKAQLGQGALTMKIVKTCVQQLCQEGALMRLPLTRGNVRLFCWRGHQHATAAEQSRILMEIAAEARRPSRSE